MLNMVYDELQVDRTQGRVTCTLSRPKKKNALTKNMFFELEDLIDDIKSEEVDVITIRGSSGDFSAGVDMTNVPKWIEQKPLEVRDQLERIHDTLRLIERLDVPVVAAIEGYCLGGALELAISCDLRIAAADAKFGLPESKLGLAINYGGGQKLPGIIGEGMAKYLVMTGEIIGAPRALEIGLVGEVADSNEFEENIINIEEKLANKPTYVHGLAKRQIHSVRPAHMDEAMETAIFHAVAGYKQEETQKRSLEFIRNK